MAEFKTGKNDLKFEWMVDTPAFLIHQGQSLNIYSVDTTYVDLSVSFIFQLKLEISQVDFIHHSIDDNNSKVVHFVFAADFSRSLVQIWCLEKVQGGGFTLDHSKILEIPLQSPIEMIDAADFWTRKLHPHLGETMHLFLVKPLNSNLSVWKFDIENSKAIQLQDLSCINIDRLLIFKGSYPGKIVVLDDRNCLHIWDNSFCGVSFTLQFTLELDTLVVDLDLYVTSDGQYLLALMKESGELEIYCQSRHETDHKSSWTKVRSHQLAKYVSV